MRDQRQTSSRFDNLAAILLCFIALVGCVAMVGVQQAYRMQRLKVEAQRAELMAKKSLVNSAQAKTDFPKKNDPGKQERLK